MEFENNLTYQTYQTPIGQLLGAFSGKGLLQLKFYNSQKLDTELEILTKKYKNTFLNKPADESKILAIQLDEYFSGKRQYFDTTLSIKGTEFQISVWEELQKIPYGSTVSYKAQALSLKKPKAIRAVAAANGKNNIAIIIPCHRVIGKNGDLIGYAGGLERKKHLLDLEKNFSRNKK